MGRFRCWSRRARARLGAKELAKSRTLLSSSLTSTAAKSIMQPPAINFTQTTATRRVAAAAAVLTRTEPSSASSSLSSLRSNASQLPTPPLPPPSSTSFTTTDGNAAAAAASSGSSKNNNKNRIKSTKQNIKTRNACYRHSNNFAFLALVSTIFIMTILLFICIGGVTSLNCYTCSSYDNPACDESFSIAGNLTGTDCDRDGKQGKVCRKLVQYIEKKKVVIRECGYLNEHGDQEQKPMCYKRSGTFALMMESCICYGDLCNHSASLVPNRSVLSALISAVSGFIVLLGAGQHLLGPGVRHQS